MTIELTCATCIRSCKREPKDTCIDFRDASGNTVEQALFLALRNGDASQKQESGIGYFSQAMNVSSLAKRGKEE